MEIGDYEIGLIKDNVHDLVADLLYYDRKEDEGLPVGVIEQAIKEGKISPQEIISLFSAELIKNIQV